MKKTATGLYFLITLLLLLVTGIQIVNSVAANPYIPEYFPLEPVMVSPSITVNQPVQNQIYGSSDVWLNFSIIKPEEWFVKDVARDESDNSMTLTVGEVTSVYYILDNGEPHNVTLNDRGLPSEYSINIDPNKILNFSTHLTMPEGMHFVKICFEANSYYYTGWDDPDPGLRSVVINGSSETIRFSVSEPFPAVLVAAASGASVAVVGVSLLLYFRKRNH